MGNDRSRAQAPHGLKRTSWLYCGKEYHTTIFTIWEELCSSVGFHMAGFSDLCVWLVFMRLSRLPLMKVLHTQEVMNTHPAL
jgi:hypothetical protein